MNIYIKAMEIGYQENNGITYVEIKSEIERSLKMKMDTDLEYVFIEWFIHNFKSPSLNSGGFQNLLYGVKQYLEGNAGDSQGNTSIYNRFQDRKFYLMGQTVKQYLDYIELKESREQARKAFIISMISIFLALASFISSWFLTADKPELPFEMKIIENKVKTRPLENRIDSLENELQKADFLINIYEEKNN